MERIYDKSALRWLYGVGNCRCFFQRQVTCHSSSYNDCLGYTRGFVVMCCSMVPTHSQRSQQLFEARRSHLCFSSTRSQHKSFTSTHLPLESAVTGLTGILGVIAPILSFSLKAHQFQRKNQLSSTTQKPASSVKRDREPHKPQEKRQRNISLNAPWKGARNRNRLTSITSLSRRAV